MPRVSRRAADGDGRDADVGEDRVDGGAEQVGAEDERGPAGVVHEPGEKQRAGGDGGADGGEHEAVVAGLEPELLLGEDDE